VSSKNWNPPNRFHPIAIEWEEPPPPAKLHVVEDDTQGILAHNDSPDVGFEWSVNPYRGCSHACAYCYARPTHEYLGYGAGTDFERTIVVKRRAPLLLRDAFDTRSWKGELVAFSGVTDCYQPLERKYELTRACLAVCAEYRNPVSIITRSPLVTRDLDVLAALNAHQAIRVSVSIPIIDPVMQRKIEPGAPPPSARLAAIGALAAAGIPVGVSISPVIPGINESTIPETLRAAREQGARWAWMIPLRLPGAVADVFQTRLREALPDRADRVLNGIRRMRGGALNDSRHGERMKGTGASWEATEALFRLWHARLGFEDHVARGPSPFQRPGEGQQLGLWGGTR
jgi:DNA repair photolyase